MLSIETDRISLDKLDVPLQASITSVVSAPNSLQDQLEADPHWNLLPVVRVYIKIYEVVEDTEGRVFITEALLHLLPNAVSVLFGN